MVEVKGLSLKDSFPLRRDDPFWDVLGSAHEELRAGEVFSVALEEFTGAAIAEVQVDGLSGSVLSEPGHVSLSESRAFGS
jgi:hypothetical protein